MVIIVVAVEEVSREIIHCYQHFIYLDMIYLFASFSFVFVEIHFLSISFSSFFSLLIREIAQQEFLFIFRFSPLSELSSALRS